VTGMRRRARSTETPSERRYVKTETYVFLSDMSLSAPPPRSEYPVMPPSVCGDAEIRSMSAGRLCAPNWRVNVLIPQPWIAAGLPGVNTNRPAA
jgi:hypothetical protein